MDSTKVKPAHVYKCARCGLIFGSDRIADICPECYCRMLIHVEGEKPNSNKNCSGNCSSCGCGCGC